MYPLTINNSITNPYIHDKRVQISVLWKTKQTILSTEQL